MLRAGVHVLAWVRNHHSHVWLTVPHIRRGGLTSAVVAEAVHAAVQVLLARPTSCHVKLGADGVLVRA